MATVNGSMEPNLNVNKGLYRFRTLNGSNARFYHLRLALVGPNGQPTSINLPFFQIGTDGGLLKGVRFHTGRISTWSLSMRARSGTIRFIQTQHDPDRSTLVARGVTA